MTRKPYELPLLPLLAASSTPTALLIPGVAPGVTVAVLHPLPRAREYPLGHERHACDVPQPPDECLGAEAGKMPPAQPTPTRSPPTRRWPMVRQEQVRRRAGAGRDAAEPDPRLDRLP